MTTRSSSGQANDCRRRLVVCSTMVALFAVILFAHDASRVYADHAFWGEGRSANLSGVTGQSWVDVVPVTLRTSDPQVDIGALLRFDPDGAYGSTGLVVRSSMPSDTARGFFFACTDSDGCTGEFARSDGRLKTYSVNKGISTGRFNSGIVAFNETGGGFVTFFGHAPDADFVTLLRSISGDHDEEDDLHVGFYGRIQENDVAGAFTTQYPLRRSIIGSSSLPPSPPVVTDSYSFTALEHPSSSIEVRHFTITAANRGICAVFTSEDGCPDE